MMCCDDTIAEPAKCRLCEEINTGGIIEMFSSSYARSSGTFQGELDLDETHLSRGRKSAMAPITAIDVTTGMCVR